VRLQLEFEDGPVVDDDVGAAEVRADALLDCDGPVIIRGSDFSQLLA
jgi:hypothetical protein